MRMRRRSRQRAGSDRWRRGAVLWSAGLLLAAFAGPGAIGPCVGGEPALEQVLVTTPGFREPRTPGAGTSDELPLSPVAAALLGAEPDLNRITTVRTRRTGPAAERPVHAVVILIPGFLGGAGNFDPLARQLVRSFEANVEVWAVDRRTSQLEDRRGARRARARMEAALAEGDVEAAREALADGVRFAFGPIDLDGDGLAEPPPAYENGLGGYSPFLRLEQDDARFLAHWGLDTHVRDWRTLVDEARALVGEGGLVVLGGHSLGTSFAGVYAAYDFDAGPAVDPGWLGLDGLLLLEGGGPSEPSDEAPDLPSYRASIAELQARGGPDVFLSDLFGFGIDPVALGVAGELSGLAGTYFPDDPAILKKTNLFGGFPLFLFFLADVTNRALVGLFLDDDFSANPAFSASFGFTDDGPNAVTDLGDFYVAQPAPGVRTWKDFDDPTLPTCPPNDPEPMVGSGGVGCAIVDNGPRPPPDVEERWGVEREVTDTEVLLRSLYETANASEWYFATRPLLDLQFGRDARALGDERLLNVTQNATVAVPVLGIGGSNGLAPTEAAFASYLGSIATPAERKRVAILEGYSHVDVTTASGNEAVPLIRDWIRGLRR